jgi:hypothetical protein
MDDQTILNLGQYAAIVGGALVFCKYILQPFIQRGSERQTEWERGYARVTEERAKALVELGKTGRSQEEISDLVKETLPFPEY